MLMYGASVNSGIHNGLGALIKRDAQLLQVINRFNHRIELAPLKKFWVSYIFCIKVYLSDWESYKRIREAYNITVPKPANAHGSRWLDHKIRAMLIALESYGILLNHIESLS